ncbi:unnamed protein product [Oncorhynchus mykiss]|uniref:YTH domain-containing family protein n=1 Tax=Oncorhynchus mykiss TaxID=8022 RepID=A0A060Y2F7_ONCMY|nr:unnamed protein product [Oncorhynchus mykiss]
MCPPVCSVLNMICPPVCSVLNMVCPPVRAGFARLSSESHHGGSPIHWVLPAGMNAKMLGGVFKIDWICRRELPFTKTAHLSNSWNEHKPVKIGRDGQDIRAPSFICYRATRMLCCIYDVIGLLGCCAVSVIGLLDVELYL